MHEELNVSINGMHCASCEVMIERSFKKIDGVETVSVNHANGTARITCSRIPEMNQLQDAIAEHGYTVSSKQQTHDDPVCKQLEKPNYGLTLV